MSALKNPRTITIQDPREFDGDPYQVAERAILQIQGLVGLTLETFEATILMARNADLERELAFGNELGNAGSTWPESPQGRALAGVQANLEAAEKALLALQRAVAFNPKAR